MTTLSSQAASMADMAKSGTILAGIDNTDAIENRLAEVRNAIGEQRPIKEAAGNEAATRRAALQRAEARHSGEAVTLAVLRTAEANIETAIAGKREQARRDHEARQRQRQESEAAHRRAVEDELRSEARRRANIEAQARAGA